MTTAPALVRPAPGPQPATWPLYLLLAVGVANGLHELAFDTPASAIVFAVKAFVAAVLLLRAPWTPLLAGSVVVPVLCALAYVALRDDALAPSNAEGNVLMAKTAATVLLLAALQGVRARMPPPAVARYLLTVLAVVTVSLVLGLFGVGHERYADERAFLTANGILPSGNELNLILLALFWWLSERRQRPALSGVRRPYTWAYWICVAMMVVSSSKATIGGALLIALWFSRTRPLRLLAWMAAIPVAWLLLVWMTVWNYWVFYFGLYESQGLLSALTNGRFGRVADILPSWSALPVEGLPNVARNDYIESDLLDLAINFGWAGIMLYACFAFVLWRVTGQRLVPWLLVITTSVFAGHVAISVFAAPVLVCALAATRSAARAPLSGHVAQQAPGGAIG